MTSEIVPHGGPLPDDPEHAEFVHPEAQGLVALIFCAGAAILIALAPIATRAAPLQKGWWVEPITWPLFTLGIVFVAAAVQVVGFLRARAAAPDRKAFREKALWGLQGMRPAFEYAALFCAYLVLVNYLGFALASLIFIEVVIWRAGLRSRNWALAGFLFVAGLVLAFRVGIELWFPVAPIYEVMPDWFIEHVAVYL